MKKILLVFALILPLTLMAQNIEDALRFSRTENFSTARSMGVAGAFGAMGADFGAISYNPASVGNYWKGEMVFSIGYHNTSTTGILGNTSNRRDDQSFSFDNIGLVSNWRTVTDKSIISRSFAIGLNSVANYDYDMYAEGDHSGSIFENTDLFEGINYDPYTGFDINKRMDLKESGGSKELLFAYGQNHNNKIIWGFSAGIPFINYSTTRNYSEIASGELISNPALDFYFDNLVYNTGYNTVGTGLNFKGGVIVSLPASTRVGFSVHTPTWLRLKDDYYEYLDISGINNWEFTQIDYEGYFDYNLRTPWKFIGSLGKIFGDTDLGGFVNIDAEYINNPGMKFNFTRYSNTPEEEQNQREANEELERDLKGAFNIRLGGELAIKKFRIRAGAAFYDSPFKADADSDPGRVLSAGIGYRGDSYYVDFAYVNSMFSYGYLPYTADIKARSPRVEIDKLINKFNVTVGLRF